MLKKITVDELRLGMHLHALDGKWHDHPFWRTGFKLTEESDIRKLRGSAVRACWIDLSLGRDVEGVDQPGSVAAAASRSSAPCAALDPPATERQPITATVSMCDELRRAGAILAQSAESLKLPFTRLRQGKSLDLQACMPLVQDIIDSVLRHSGALVSLARLKPAEGHAHLHSVAVCALMVALGRRMGLHMDAMRQVGLAGLLHDVGKGLLPRAIVNKPGKLSPAEYEQVKTHPLRGLDMLRESGIAASAVLEVCLHHHEKVDGSGYPKGLRGTGIPLFARMAAVCDVYDALTSNRSYKAGWDPAESLARMASWKGHFDPMVLDAFTQAMGTYPVGSLVQLQSGRLAVVAEQNADALASPLVKAFFSTRTLMHIPPESIDLAAPGEQDRIVGREAVARWHFTRLDELWATPEALALAC